MEYAITVIFLIGLLILTVGGLLYQKYKGRTDMGIK